MMDNGNEWYWNLNLHRNGLMLNNVPSLTHTKLPISSARYTSAVLTDCGICVGMRNVNLKGANQLELSKINNIPNCYGNSSVVGQRNKQTWTAAYDQMRYSALSDPTMATQIRKKFFGVPQNPTEWNDPTTIHMDYKPCTSSLMSAELNPFHLFGDKSSLSSLNLSESYGYEYPMNGFYPMEHNIQKLRDDTLTSCPMNFASGFNHQYHNESDDKYNRIHLNGYPHPNHSITKSMSFRSNSPTIYSTNGTMKVTATNSKRRMKTNIYRSNHVVAPKKKWIRNYMKSNSHLWFFFQ